MLNLADAHLAGPAGADYVDAPIIRNVVIQDADDRWVANPDFHSEAPIPSFALLFPGADFAVSDPDATPEQWAAIESYLEVTLAAVGAVAESGAPVVLGSGKARAIPDGADRAAAAAALARTVRLARDIAVRHGLRLVLEPLNKGETDLVNTIAEAADFLDEQGIEGVGIVADLYHVMLEEEPLAVVQQLAGRIGHAHIADSGRVPPGQGDWPMAEFLGALRAGGYAGNVTIECQWADLASEIGPAVAALRAADAAATV